MSLAHSTRKQYVQISLDGDDLPTHFRQILLFMNPEDYKALERYVIAHKLEDGVQDVILGLVRDFIKQ